MELLEYRLKIARLIAEKSMEIINEEDQKELIHWLCESEKHREEYNKIQKLLSSEESIWQDYEEGRILMEKRIKKMDFWRDQGKIRRLRGMVKIAAAVILFFCLSMSLFLWINEVEQPLEITTVPIIEHGESKALLELADGKRINIRADTYLKVREIDGTQISTVGSLIKYTKCDTQLNNNKSLNYNTLIIPRGGEFSLELADGTKVWLNAESKLRYPVYFSENERRVEMEGEVYFEVKKNREKPFIVTVGGMNIQVLGTSFNVLAYHENVITTLIEGKIELKKENKNMILLPNQQASWQNDQFHVKQVDARNYVLWKEGIFYFENANLETILEGMARWYNVDILYMKPELKLKRFSVEIKRYEDINVILEKIEKTKRVKFKIIDKTIHVYE